MMNHQGPLPIIWHGSFLRVLCASVVRRLALEDCCLPQTAYRLLSCVLTITDPLAQFQGGNAEEGEMQGEGRDE